MQVQERREIAVEKLLIAVLRCRAQNRREHFRAHGSMVFEPLAGETACFLSRSLQKFTNVFLGQGSARGGELVEELGEIPTGELPFKRPSCGFPIVLKVQEALREGVEIGKVVGG